LIVAPHDMIIVRYADDRAPRRREEEQSSSLPRQTHSIRLSNNADRARGLAPTPSEYRRGSSMPRRRGQAKSMLWVLSHIGAEE
jgi:hypothetical protein